MPLYLPNIATSVAPWDLMEKLLRAKPEEQEKFRLDYGTKHSFVIAKWYFGDTPAEYLFEDSLDYPEWRFFGDPALEDPMQYPSFEKILEAIQGAKNYDGYNRIGIIFWVHPSSDYQPTEGYRRMSESGQFRGHSKT